MKHGGVIEWDKVGDLACSVMVSAKCATWSDGLAAESTTRCREKVKAVAKELGLEVRDETQPR